MYLDGREVRDPVTALQINQLIDKLQTLFSKLMIFTGNGSPEGEVAAKVGSLYLRLDGSTNTTLYVKESGDKTLTGWVAK